MGRRFTINGDLDADDFAASHKDGTAATPSLRTLGTGAAQAAAGDHTHPGGGLADGTYGDVTVSGSGATWTVDKVDGVTPTAAGLALLDDVSASAQRTTLGLGTAAVVDTGTGASNVPTVTQADARYPRRGLAVAMLIAPPLL